MRLNDRIGKLKRWLFRAYTAVYQGRVPHPGWCRGCRRIRWLVFCPSMTMYHHEKGTPDPNVVGFLCKPCVDEYCEYWSERWDEYYSGLM